MTPEQKAQRKYRLNDPLRAYTEEFNNEDTSAVARLTQLTQQYDQTKREQKDCQTETQILSRQIGAARKSDQSTDELTASMREKSANNKALKNRLQELENDILACFDRQTQHDKPIEQRYSDILNRHYKHQTETSTEIRISIFDDMDYSRWNRYVENHPDATIYHLCEWRELIHNTFGHSYRYIYATNENNEMIGVLPLIRLQSRLFGDFFVSMPYFNYGGALADTPEIEQKLMQHADEMAKNAGVKHIEYRDTVSRPDYPARTDKVNMILALPDSVEVLWDGFKPSLRAQIKRPQRENPQTKIGGIELLDDFYRVFARNMRDLGTPVYSKTFFANILKQFPEQANIIVIVLKGKPVAAAFLLGHRSMLEIPWASTVRTVNHLSINMLLYWEVLSFAIKKGYDFFDFGRSSIDSGTYRFKKQWGAVPKPLHWHYWLPQGEKLPALNPSNPKFTLMINIWRRLPVFVTKIIGPGVVKNLP